MIIKKISDPAYAEKLEFIEKSCFSLPWSIDDVRMCLTDKLILCFGCFEADKLIGWGCASAVFGEGHILTVSILPEYRRRGYGRQLVNALVQITSDAGADYVYLECRENNHAAQSLYKSIGFEYCGIEPNYYPDTDEDALIYILKDLPEGNPDDDPYIEEENAV